MSVKLKKTSPTRQTDNYRVTRLTSAPSPTGASAAARYTPHLEMMMRHPQEDENRFAKAVAQKTAIDTVAAVLKGGLKKPMQTKRSAGVTLEQYSNAIDTLSGVFEERQSLRHPTSLFADLSCMAPATALDLTTDAGKIVCLANLIAILDTQTPASESASKLKNLAQAASKAVVARRHFETLSQITVPRAADAEKVLQDKVEGLQKQAQTFLDTMTSQRIAEHLSHLFTGVEAHIETLVSKESTIGLALPAKLAHTAASYLYAFYSSGLLQPQYAERIAASAGCRRLLACNNLSSRPASWAAWVADTAPGSNLLGQTAQNLALKTLLGPAKDTLTMPQFLPWLFVEYAFGGSGNAGRIILGHRDAAGPQNEPEKQTWAVMFIDSSHITGRPGTYEKTYAEIIAKKMSSLADL